MVNRKLVRPNLAELKEKFAPGRVTPAGSGATAPAIAPAPTHREGQGGGGANAGPRRRPVPPDQTSAEAFYYVKQMNSKTPMVVVLDDGQELRGHIEWYDRGCLKVNREGAPNLLVFKHAIKYVYKQEEENRGATEPASDSLD